MTLSISIVLFLAIIVLLLIRAGHQRIGPAIVTGLFGFYLASTGIAPTIHQAITSVSGLISSI